MSIYAKFTGSIKSTSGAALASNLATLTCRSVSASVSRTCPTDGTTSSASSMGSSFKFTVTASSIATGYTFSSFSVVVSDKNGNQLASRTFSSNPSGNQNTAWDLESICSAATSSSKAVTINVTLYLTPPNVTVSYNANGGSPTPASQTVTLGSSVTLAGAITKSGYTFGGWSIGGTTYAAGATYKPTGNVTAIAIWNAPSSYNIIFVDGGATVATITAKHGQTIGSGGNFAWPTVSPPSGYTLSGWQIGGTIYTPSQRYTVTGNVTATAIISGSSSTLYALTNSAAVAGSDYTWNCTLVIKQSGVTATLPDGYDLIPSSSAVKVSKAGIKFYTGTNYSPVNYKVISGLNLDISTSFKGQTVSVTGRRSVGGMIYTSSGGYASDDTLFVITPPEGYRAYGWIWGKGYNGQNASTGFLLGDTFPLRLWGIISQEHQYHALVPVLIKVHKVTFDPNGGTGGPSPAEAVHGENWTCPLTFPTRTGYTCKGWSTSKTATSPEFVAGRTYGPLTADLTVYAVWVPNRGILAFNANGGTVLPDYKAVNVGDAYGTLPTPSRSGCTFIGWFTAASGGNQVYSTTKMGTGGVAIIYAHWTKSGSTTETYVVVFLDTTGTNPETCRSFEVGATVTLPKIGAGLGWTIPPECEVDQAAMWIDQTGNVYANMASVKDLAPSGEEFLLNAAWVTRSYTITFNSNGGIVGETSRSRQYGQQLGTLPTPTRDGYNFDGWFTAATGGTKIEATATVSADATYYAHWSEAAVDWWEIETW